MNSAKSVSTYYVTISIYIFQLIKLYKYRK